VPKEGSKVDGMGRPEIRFVAEASALEKTVDAIYTSVFKEAGGLFTSSKMSPTQRAAHTILLINPNKDRLAEGVSTPMGTRVDPKTIRYAYQYHGAGNSQVWVGRGR